MPSGKRQTERKGNAPVNTGPSPNSDGCTNNTVEEAEEHFVEKHWLSWRGVSVICVVLPVINVLILCMYVHLLRCGLYCTLISVPKLTPMLNEQCDPIDLSCFVSRSEANVSVCG
ncbi:hypothetical protein T03_14364 [Trichinella britovi]|uniref:Uncharacterized protein n=1 Tax=Trichinella britovi TaxID=45882 RepID=A0A0V1CJ98_TRIBR|nr:hypothetical protein T03_14364 [Trichinella britovi]